MSPDLPSQPGELYVRATFEWRGAPADEPEPTAADFAYLFRDLAALGEATAQTTLRAGPSSSATMGRVDIRIAKVRMQSDLEVLLHIVGSGVTLAGVLQLFEWALTIDLRIKSKRAELRLAKEQAEVDRRNLRANYQALTGRTTPRVEDLLRLTSAEVFDQEELEP